jgi:Spy/CpxP family protein refolding chaperone
MKKKMMIMVVVAGLALVGTASAQGGKGGGYGHHGKMQGGMMYQQLDQQTRDKIKQFRDDNQSLRKEMVMKRAEKRALMNSTNPDPVAAAKIAGELFDLRTAMRAKAEAAGIDNYMGRFGMGGRMGSGSMMGPGSMMGRGPGNCQGGARF